MRIAWLVTITVLGCGGGSSDDPAVTEAPVAAPGDAAAAKSSDAAPVAPPRPEHAVYSLVDNRHAVHRYADGDLVLDAADVGFARYTHFSVPKPRWKLGQSIGGLRAAEADRLAVLEVPLDARLAKGIDRIVVRVFGHAKQQLAIKLNGRRPGKTAKASRVELVEGWQTVTQLVEPKLLGVGENQIVLETTGGKGNVGIEWMRLATKEPPDGDPRAAVKLDAKTNTITLAKNATAIWYVTIPEGAHLVGEVAGSCKAEVQAVSSDDSFAGGALGPDHPRVDLTTMAGKVVGLTITARDCAETKLVAPEIMVRGPTPTVAPKADPPRYILLWVMDALRADKVPTFTPGARAQTPNFDELAKSSTVFRQYYVQGNESQTSHSSVWTGLYPAVHGVRLAGQGGTWRIEAKFDVVAGKLRDAGMYTAAVTGNGFVNEEGGYARGFREYRNMMRETGIENGIIYGEKIVGAALGRLEAHRDTPTYLFFGTIDTHGPWIARKPWIDIYSPGPYNGPFVDFGTAKDLGFKPGSMGCGIIPPPADIERLRAIYDSAISYQDKQIGRVVDQLKAWGIWDKTMLVITADHGEEMFEDRRCGHGGSLRDSLIRVPLIIHDPARFPGGTIVDEGAEGVDLMPTFLDALGAPAVPAVQGESLAALAQGVNRGWARSSYSSMYEYAHAMRIGRWKIRVGQGGVPIIVDMVADPDERNDLAGTRPVERRMLTDNLSLFLALRTQWKKTAWGVPTNVTKPGAAALDEAHAP
ncbi:MAG: sulfatase [Kofleriaceae bacterium]